jgi:hypothetical protein
MAAPTNAAYVKKSPCQLGAVHTWHNADMQTAASAFGGRAAAEFYEYTP